MRILQKPGHPGAWNLRKTPSGRGKLLETYNVCYYTGLAPSAGCLRTGGSEDGTERSQHNRRFGMTETGASNRPQSGSITSRRSRMLRRGLLAVPVTLGLMLPAGAGAAEATNGYTQTPPPPPGTTTTTTVTTPPVTVTTSAPAAKKVVPKKGVSPSVNIGEPVTIKPSPAPTTLPFTGLDLRWIIGAGILLLGMGFTLRILQRRARSH